MTIRHDENGSTRILPNGTSEEAGWIDVDGGRMYHVTRVPAGRTLAVLTLCPAVGGEADGGYRRQTMLARALVDHGVAVRRIHYRGSGNSDANTVMTRETMLADAMAAGAGLSARFPEAQRLVLGERLGAMVAAEVAARSNAHGLVLWHPVTEAESYVRELLRAAKLQRLATGDVSGEKSAAMFDDDYADGVGDLAGFAVERSMIDSFLGHPLSQSIPGPGCSTVLVQFGRKSVSGPFAKVLEQWSAAGTPTESVIVPESELWWFAPGPWKRGEEMRPVTVAVLEATVPVVRRLVTAVGAP